MPISLVFSSILSSAAHGATIFVPEEEGSLQSAIDAAADGDTLILAPGWQAPIAVTGGKTLTLQGSPVGDSVVSGLRVSGGDVTLRGVVVTDSGVLAEAAAVTLDHVTVQDAGSSRGPAISAQAGASLTLTDTTLARVSGPKGAITATTTGSLSLSGVTIEDCIGDAAGAIYVDGATATLSEVEISACEGLTGGGIAAISGALTLSSVSIHDTSAEQGGALYVGTGATVLAEDVRVKSNTATTGGHVVVDGGALTWTRGVLQLGSAQTGGGVAVLDGSATIRNALWHRLGAGTGGALAVSGGTVAVAHSVFAVTEADVGSAVYIGGGVVELSSSVLAQATGAVAIDNAAPVPVTLSQLLFSEDNAGNWSGPITADGLQVGDPLFTDTARGDWTLRAGSPGLDAAAGLDHDGTTADIGIFGGVHAVALADEDGDGFVYGRDCNDTDAFVNEAEPEAFYDGIDADCDGWSDFDADRDGFDAESVTGGGDCDDFDAAVYPGATELRDGIDSNCDGVDLIDADGDGFGYDADCDDFDAAIYPGAEESWYNGIDEDCAADNDFDQDGDGFIAQEYGDPDVRLDCDDTDPFVSPSMPEIADDGIDNDCRGGDHITDDDDGSGEVVEVPGEVEGEHDAVFIDEEDEPVDRMMTTTGCTSAGAAPGAILAVLGFLLAAGRRRGATGSSSSGRS